MLLWSMLRTEPFFVVQRILQKGLRWLQQESGSATIQYSDPPVRSKFDLQIIPQVEPPDESRRSRRNLVRLAAVDAKLNLFPEP
ncbi:hypothetical protein B5K03_27055 [Rhizobium phaseoli]|nr:hypothetical protein B5K03_27055 [Rhizobium phaseoli]